MATLSILALYDYDQTVLEGLISNLPKASAVPVDEYPDTYVTPKDIDANALIDNIIIECAELEFMYPDITLAKRAVTAWAVGMSHKWQKLYNTLWMAYNPLWNNWRRFNSQRDITNTGNNTETRNLTSTKDITRNAETTDNTEYTSTNTRTDDLTQSTDSKLNVAAYNSASLEPREGTTATVTNSGTVKTDDSGSGTVTSSGNETVEESGTNGGTVKTDSTNTNSDTYTEQTEGSIGVTTSETMLKQEREVALFNIYDIITTDFKNRFCLLIY